MTVSRIQIPAPLVHQVEPYEAPERHKVLQCGRRAGKSVLALGCAVLGHGPLIDGERKWKGIVHGRDVLWIAPTEKQLKALWSDYIRKRFAGKPGIKLNENDHEVRFQGYGSIFMQSAHLPEVIDNMRGRGANVGGIIFDECAHFDLKYAWLDVAAPMLLDLGGWAIFASTTNWGHDGNRDMQVPSYFNRLAEEVETQQRGPNWRFFYRTAFDNPKMDPELIEELINEYEGGRDNPQCQQEVFAKRVRGGIGLACPEWNDQAHTTQMKPEQMTGWRWYGGLDWGSSSPGCLVVIAEGPERKRVVRFDWYFKRLTASQAGEQAGMFLKRFPPLEYVIADSAMFDPNGTNQTLAELFQTGLNEAMGKEAVQLLAVVKRGREGKTSRQTRLMMLREGLSWEQPPGWTQGDPIPDWMQPRLTFHLDAKNTRRTIPRLVLDEKDSEDVNTEQDDHAYDALTYPLLWYMPEVQREPSGPEFDVHQGLTRGGKVVNPWKGPSETGRGPFRVEIGWSDRDSEDQRIEEEF